MDVYHISQEVVSEALNGNRDCLEKICRYTIDTITNKYRLVFNDLGDWTLDDFANETALSVYNSVLRKDSSLKKDLLMDG